MLTEKSTGSSFTDSLPRGNPPWLLDPADAPFEAVELAGFGDVRGCCPSLLLQRPHTRPPLPGSWPVRVSPHNAPGILHASRSSFLLCDRCPSRSRLCATPS